MKNLIRNIILAASVVFWVPTGFATTYGGSVDTTNTTLSAAIVANTTTQWCVASATGIVLPSLASNTTGSYLFVDKEAVQVTSQGTSSTCYNVKRGQLGTSANYSHASSAAVWVGNVATGTGDNSHPFSGGVLTPNVPDGTCTASAQYSLPLIIYGPPNAYASGARAYCTGGNWVLGFPQQKESGAFPYSMFTTISPPNPITTASVSYVVGTEFWGQLSIPYDTNLTGACILNGATVGTSKVIYFLADSAGNILATTALAGTTTATASKYQCIAFTGTIRIPGPGTYFIGVQADNVTDNFQSYATASVPTLYGTGSQTGVFATVAAITPTLTFTASKGPLAMVY